MLIPIVYGGLAVAGDKAVPEYGAALPAALFMVYSRKEPEVQWACVKYLGVAFAVGFAVKYALSRS